MCISLEKIIESRTLLVREKVLVLVCINILRTRTSRRMSVNRSHRYCIGEAECLGSMAKGSNAVISGTVSMNTAGSTVSAVCNSGYIWAGGQTGPTPKTATCTDTGSSGTWTLTDTCVGALFGVTPSRYTQDTLQNTRNNTFAV